MVEITKKRSKCKVLVIVLATITIGTGCFFAGRSTIRSKYTVEQAMIDFVAVPTILFHKQDYS